MAMEGKHVKRPRAEQEKEEQKKIKAEDATDEVDIRVATEEVPKEILQVTSAEDDENVPDEEDIEMMEPSNDAPENPMAVEGTGVMRSREEHDNEEQEKTKAEDDTRAATAEGPMEILQVTENAENYSENDEEDDEMIEPNNDAPEINPHYRIIQELS